MYVNKYYTEFMDIIDYRTCTSKKITNFMANIILITNILSWLFYFIERKLVKKNHKKFIKKKNVLILHVISGIFETLLGYYMIYHSKVNYYYILSTIAIIHSLTNIYLIPNVWGLKYITVPGYVIVSLMRLYESLNILFNQNKLHYISNLWILLQTATLVRLLSYFVYPWNSKKDKYGDLSVNPIIYTGSVSTAALICCVYVYDPYIVFVVLLILALSKMIVGHGDIQVLTN